MRAGRRNIRAIQIAGALALAAGILGGGAATAGTSNESFYVYYQGGTVSVDRQTKAITGTPGYVQLSHNYPTGREAKFRLAHGDYEGTWSETLRAGQNGYMNNKFSSGRLVRMDATMTWGTENKTLKGVWRSN